LPVLLYLVLLLVLVLACKVLVLILLLVIKYLLPKRLIFCCNLHTLTSVLSRQMVSYHHHLFQQKPKLLATYIARQSSHQSASGNSLQQLNRYLDMDDDEVCLTFLQRDKSSLNKLIHPENVPRRNRGIFSLRRLAERRCWRPETSQQSARLRKMHISAIISIIISY